ncbi:MAG: hypothetical protein AB1486_31095 [Planctomycetota bacterium]
MRNACTTHYHALVLDGVFTRDPVTQAWHFQALAGPSEEETARLLDKIRKKIVHTLRRHGLLPADDALDEALAPESPLFAACQAVGIDSRRAWL